MRWNLERLRLKINGIVQGVGFRPFINRLVREYSLAGYIRNTSSGVELELDGERESLENFVIAIQPRAPKLAVIENISATYGLPPANFSGFEIRSSETEESRNTLISPDICICEDCLRELNDSRDKRFRYPFINCTNCGPRFTIIKDVPYDRARTSMSDFPMCPECEREYKDIENRRYHAQPDCCPDCGPEVTYYGPDGMPVCSGSGAIETARRELITGGIVAVKGLGGIHLACRCDSDSSGTVNILRLRKRRDEKPFAVMCRDIECAEKICEIDESEKNILLSFRRPIVLLKKRSRTMLRPEDKNSGKAGGTAGNTAGCGKETVCPESNAALDAVSCNGYVGVMLPYTPLHYLLFGDDIDMLVMTSANLSNRPVMYRNEDALGKLKGIADGFLLHNRDIQTRCDDSLCFAFEGQEYFVRRSRGYAPFPVTVSRNTADIRPLPRILACGAEQKASFALSKGSYIFPGQHIGDLKNQETFDFYKSQIEHFERLFDIEPEAAVCDLHPDYMSSEYAAELSTKRGIPLVRVQHHHAHMASCMADNGLEGNVIALTWDGTGLGTDGTIWGGECLIGGYTAFERFGSIRPVPLIGGDAAVREIDRTGFALLTDAGETEAALRLTEIRLEIYKKMLSCGINCPLSSGIGRLFDGVAAVTGIRHVAGYEGQGAVLLEAAAEENESGRYGLCFYDVPETGRKKADLSVMIFDSRPVISEIVKDAEKGTPNGVIAARFMNTLAAMALEQCKAARSSTGLDRVVLSGGSFQNMYIMKRLPGLLKDAGFKVYTHRRVSCNDEGLSLGQLMTAAAQL